MSIWDADGRVERLKKLRTEGKSASEIAKLLGHGITKNAVLGKLDRLGLLKQDLPSRPKTPRPMAQRPAHPAPKFSAPKPKIVQQPTVSAITGGVLAGPFAAPVLPPPKADAFKPLPGTTPAEFGTPHRCKWPIDGYAQPMCCGLRLADSRYCETHVQMSGGPAPTNAKQLARSLRWAA